jgi:hypothetical protein
MSTMTDEIERMGGQLWDAGREHVKDHRMVLESQFAVQHYREDADEVHRLRAEVTELRRALASTRLFAMEGTNALPAQPASSEAASQPASTAPITDLPVKFDSIEQMAKVVGDLRARAFAGQLSSQERDWLNQLRPQLEKLEGTPAEFAELQADLIARTTGISDPERVAELKQVLQRTYDTALMTGLDSPARPEDDHDWKQRRLQLDRRGMAAVHTLLSDEERASFDQAFAGIMGIDLGTGLDKSLYPEGYISDRK